MAWSNLVLDTDRVKGLEEYEFLEPSSAEFVDQYFDEHFNTTQRATIARSTMRDMIIEHSGEMVLDYDDEDAFFDAIQGESSLSSRLDTMMTYAWLHHWFFGSFDGQGTTDHEKADYYMNRLVSATKALAKLIPKALSTELTVRRAPSVVISASRSWGTL